LKIGLLCVAAVAVAALFAVTGTASAATGKIEGKVIDAVTTLGIEEVEVCAIDPLEFEAVACAETDADGKYALSGLANGKYVVGFRAPYLGYITQYYNGQESFEEAEEVVIAGGGTVSGINAEMERGGEIAGRVTDALTGAGIEEVEVCAFSQHVFGGCAFTDATGNYTIQGVATGSYAIEFWAEFLGYETRYYNEEANPAGANLVSVVAPNTTSGINARLSKPASRVTPSATRTVISAPALPAMSQKPKPKPKTCKKNFKRVKRHGHTVCVRKHKKKHRA
jgi:hypothetical protein